MSTLGSNIQLAELMKSGAYSDLKLACHGQEFSVHKMVVCSQSRVLAAAVNGEFEEAAKNVINIAEFEIDTVRCMIEYLYTGDYSVSANEAEQDEQNTVTNHSKSVTEMEDLKPATLIISHVKVNAIADYYDIKCLMDHATSKILDLERNQPNPGGFLAAVKEALDSTGDRNLFDGMALLIAEKADQYIDQPGMQDFFNDFALSVIRNLVRVNSERSAELQREIDYLHREKLAERERYRKVEIRADTVKQNINTCREMLRDRNTCRNESCCADFSCYIEQRGTESEPIYVLRCSKCQCRHL